MSLLQTLGGLIGLAVGGPTGAAIGSGIGTLAGGGNFSDALKSGIMNFGIGSLPGGQAMLAQNAFGSMMGGGGGGGGGMSFFGGGDGGGGGQAPQNPLATLFGGGAGMQGAQQGQMRQGAPQGQQGMPQQQGGLGPFLGSLAQSPLVMAGLMEAFQPRGSMMTPLQEQQVATGERVPGYRGTAAPDFRYGGNNPRFAMGGFIEGPGTGTSDSIPAKIYQNGGPVQEAMLSDGEFVMTADAVRGAGGGDRAKGAAKMYEMMSRLERRA
jgi:hypothetical protein